MESDMNTANIFAGFLRMIASVFDRALFGLLQLVYRLFFSIASTDIISGATVAKFFSRIQLILGVFMLFQLAVIILKGIVDPDSFTNEKSGVGNFIVKVITALLILTVLVPINFSGANNEYQKQVSTHGLLFGTLYSLQGRILANNTIGRLVLGDISSTNGTSSAAAANDPNTAARIFTTSVLKGFYRINLKPEDQRTIPTDGREAYMIKSNRVCPNYDYSNYLKTDATNDDIISMIQESCMTTAGRRYVIAYSPLSIIAAALFIVIFVSFCMDIVVRSAKLAFLRLLAPIPVISYMDPNGSKDNMFNSWTKTLIATYIDLFVRLAAIFFVLFIVTELLARGTYGGGGYSGANHYGIIGWIIITLGLLNFARQAPKFVSDMLGIKGLGGFRLFGGLTDFRATASMVIAPATGAVAGVAANKGVGRKIWGGISGFFGGGFNTAHAYFENGDKPLDLNRVEAARMRYNDQQYAMANDGSTFGGRWKARLQRLGGIETDKHRYDRINAIYDKDAELNTQMVDWLKNDREKIAWTTKEDSVFGARTELDIRGFKIKRGDEYSIYQLEDIKARAKAIGATDDELKELDTLIDLKTDKRINTIVNKSESDPTLSISERIFRNLAVNRHHNLVENSDLSDFNVYAELELGQMGTEFTDSRGVKVNAKIKGLKGTGTASAQKSKATKTSLEYDAAKAADERIFHEENNRRH